jgi:two-component system, OmpR family, response regulator
VVNPPRVVIIEDDRDLRESIIRFLSVSGVGVEGVGSVLEFYKEIVVDNFDVAVVDVNLPDQSGFTLADYLRRSSDLGIIIITARDGMEDRVRGYGAGADLYLVKPVNMPELAAAIVNLARRSRERATPAVVSPSVEPWTLERTSWGLISPLGVKVLLSGQERTLVKCLAEASGESVSRADLCTLLGYDEAGGDSRALDSIVQRLRRKVESATGRPAPLESGYRRGYSFSANLRIE